MAYDEYKLEQHNYNTTTFAANDANGDDDLNVMAAAGWELVNSDISSFPVCTFLWARSAPAVAEDKGPDEAQLHAVLDALVADDPEVKVRYDKLMAGKDAEAKRDKALAKPKTAAKFLAALLAG
jgi:hypothetical protein